MRKSDCSALILHVVRRELPGLKLAVQRKIAARMADRLWGEVDQIMQKSREKDGTIKDLRRQLSAKPDFGVSEIRTAMNKLMEAIDSYEHKG